MSEVNIDIAFRFLVEKMQENPQVFQNYGYDLFVSNAIRKYAQTVEGLRDGDAERRVYEISEPFFDAVFELSRKGVLRPGIAKHGTQAVDDGGYSYTVFGRQWIQDKSSHHFIPTEPEEFARLLAGFVGNFGEGFHQRAQEALKCHRFGAYLASCAMCGAATESILLALAIKKEGDEEKVLKEYRAASGRKKILDGLIAHQDKKIQSAFLSCSDLLNYWRDESAHGTLSEIKENEAFTSLALLLRFAQFSTNNFDVLTK